MCVLHCVSHRVGPSGVIRQVGSTQTHTLIKHTSPQDAVLQLSAVILPDGLQRIRGHEDQLQMRCVCMYALRSVLSCIFESVCPPNHLRSFPHTPPAQLNYVKQHTYQQLSHRSFYRERDLISAEVQNVMSDGTVHLHTRTVRYGPYIKYAPYGLYAYVRTYGSLSLPAIHACVCAVPAPCATVRVRFCTCVCVCLCMGVLRSV